MHTFLLLRNMVLLYSSDRLGTYFEYLAGFELRDSLSYLRRARIEGLCHFSLLVVNLDSQLDRFLNLHGN